MTQEEILLAAVRADPGDDLPRLAYADWCEEGGRPERAEFVRVQLKLARLRRDGRGEPADREGLRRFREADARAHRLLRGDPPRPLPASPEWEWLGVGLRGISIGEPDVDRAGWVWRRGFVESVRCPLRAWLACGRDARAEHPVRQVIVTDHPPRSALHESSPPERLPRLWYGYECHDDALNPLPREVFFRLAGARLNSAHPASRWYRTERAAVDALSAACLACVAPPGPAAV